MVNPMPLSEEFPYLLNTGRGTVGQWHTHSRTREIPEVIDAVEKNAYIHMNPILARKLAIKNKEKVAVVSANGDRQHFAVKLSDSVNSDEIYAPMHYVEVNALTPSIYDSYSKEPSYKSTPVRIEKLSEECH